MDKNEKIFKIISAYKRKLENMGYKVIYIGLYGSQNYNVDDEFSDIDCKAIVMPILHDIIFRKTTSEVIEMKNGEIDVKDLITFYNVIKKGNFTYVEAMDTKYSIGDKYIKDLFKQIRPNKKSLLGAMHEKRKALTHEYPSKHEEFKKWGFDPKQFHHIVRLYDILCKNEVDNSNYSYLEYENPDFMIDIKRNKYNHSSEYVKTKSDEIIKLAKEFISSDYKYECLNLDNEISEYIENNLKIELNNHKISYARQYRTFGSPIPKKDLKKFEYLKKYNGKDISYIVYESLEIL